MLYIMIHDNAVRTGEQCGKVEMSRGVLSGPSPGESEL